MQKLDTYVERGKILRAEASTELTRINKIITHVLKYYANNNAIITLLGPIGCGKTQIAFALSHPIYYISVRDKFQCTISPTSDVEPISSVLSPSLIEAVKLDNCYYRDSMYEHIPTDKLFATVGYIYTLVTGSPYQPRSINELWLYVETALIKPILFIDHSNDLSLTNALLVRNTLRKVGIVNIWTNPIVICYDGLIERGSRGGGKILLGYSYHCFPPISLQLVPPLEHLGETFHQRIYPLILHTRPDVAHESIRFWLNQQKCGPDSIFLWLQTLAKYFTTITSDEQRLNTLSINSAEFGQVDYPKPSLLFYYWFNKIVDSDLHDFKPNYRLPDDPIIRIALLLSIYCNDFMAALIKKQCNWKPEPEPVVRILMITASHHHLTGTPISDYLIYLVRDLRQFYSKQPQEEAEMKEELGDVSKYFINPLTIPFLVPEIEDTYIGGCTRRELAIKYVTSDELRLEKAPSDILKVVFTDYRITVPDIGKLLTTLNKKMSTKLHFVFCPKIDVYTIHRQRQHASINAIVLTKVDGVLTWRSILHNVVPASGLVIFIPTSILSE